MEHTTDKQKCSECYVVLNQMVQKIYGPSSHRGKHFGCYDWYLNFSTLVLKSRVEKIFFYCMIPTGSSG